MNILQSALLVVSFAAFASAIVTACVMAIRRKSRARKCLDCGYERRHDETPHEITGCPPLTARQYIEKGPDRGRYVIGFVKHPTIDEIDHRTIGQ